MAPLGPLRRPDTSKLMTHPSTGTEENTDFHIYEMRSYMPHHPFILNSCTHHPHATQGLSPTQPPLSTQGGHILMPSLWYVCSIHSNPLGVPTHPSSPLKFWHYFNNIGLIYGKYVCWYNVTFSHRPDEANSVWSW